MSNFKNVDEILDFAIKNEEAAAAFYLELAEKVATPSMKEALKSYAKEEEGHKKRLLQVKGGNKHFTGAHKKVEDMKIADYMVEVQPNADMNYQEILNIMKQEKAAYKLYTDLAESTQDATLKSTFLGLAQEEAKHKLRFETEYERAFMGEN